MTQRELSMEIRELVSSVRQLPPEDQAWLHDAFAPDARSLEQLCRMLALNAPYVLRRHIKESGTDVPVRRRRRHR